MSDIYEQLKRPFDPKLISWRCGATNKDKTKGIALAYIDARDVMHRLDDVMGLDWQCRYSHADKKTLCEIGLKLNGEWVWRAGGAGDTDIEAEKGAISDAFKRAAVLWGIGRYLYSLPADWVEIDEWKKLKTTPVMPEWATPEKYDQFMEKRYKKVSQEKWEEMDTDEQNFLQEIANNTLAFATAKERAIYLDSQHLGADEYIALWSRFDSKSRTAIKKHQKEARKNGV